MQSYNFSYILNSFQLSRINNTLNHNVIKWTRITSCFKIVDKRVTFVQFDQKSFNSFKEWNFSQNYSSHYCQPTVSKNIRSRLKAYKKP